MSDLDQSVSRGSLTAEQAAEYTDALTRHYGEPVRPVSRYCEAFRAWHGAILDKLKRMDDGSEFEGQQRGEYQDAYEQQERDLWTSIAEHLAALQIPISKSNLLGRLIYGGESLRQRPCPEHKGQWHGCPMPGDDCQHGCTTGGNTTGWLPNA